LLRAAWGVLAVTVLVGTQGPTPFHYGYIDDATRAVLAAAWDTTDAYQNERAYCLEPTDIRVDTSRDGRSETWTVTHVTPGVTTHATPMSVKVTCARTAIGRLHTHTPTTCAVIPAPNGFTTWQCAVGGVGAHLCTVDEVDRERADHDSLQVSVVQCARDAFVFYWPGHRG